MNMKLHLILAIFLLVCVGCETVNKGANKVGEGFGKATKVADSVSEGAVDGYMGEEPPENNPYGR